MKYAHGLGEAILKERCESVSSYKDLMVKANEIRQDTLRLIFNSKTGHTGGSLSNVDILVSLYYEVMNVDPSNPSMPSRDIYIQSKGHAVESYWTILADKGFITKEELETYSKYQSRLIGHPNNKVPGVEMNTGALGHGLSIAVGHALAAKIDNLDKRVYCLMGDGEQAEGSIWEAAMAGAHYNLDKLIGIVDCNDLQITGATKDVMNSGPLDEKYRSFGWHVIEVDGHNFKQLIPALKSVQQPGKPTIILAKTVKGKGVPFAENKAEWHHKVPDEEEFKEAISFLKSQSEVLV